MKHGNGIEGREDKSNGIEILIAEGFCQINPTEVTEPSRLGREEVIRKRN
jgi:hypothetical protein